MRLDARSARISEQKINFVLMTNRKFEEISVLGEQWNDGEMSIIFKRHGINVVELQWHSNMRSTFTKSLKFSPNLSKLSVRVSRDGTPAEILPKLEKLETLHICVTENRDWLHKPRRTTIITGYPGHQFAYGTLAHFILSQDKLTSLKISMDILIELVELNVPIPFRLKRLDISDNDVDYELDQKSLLGFVKSQSKSLTELKSWSDMPSSVYAYIFSNETEINTLRLSTGEIPQYNEFYEQVDDTYDILTVEILNHEGGDEKYLGQFFKKLPNVRNLILRDYYRRGKGENTLLLAQTFSRLESISVGYIEERLIGQMKFSDIKTLHIGCLRCKINWNEFTSVHNRLTELAIRTMFKDCFTSDDVDEITSNVDLESLKLGAGFVADNRFFEIIRARCSNLKVFDLHKSCILANGYNVKVNVMRLRDSLELSL